MKERKIKWYSPIDNEVKAVVFENYLSWVLSEMLATPQSEGFLDEWYSKKRNQPKTK
jgi:hypothetical protein